LREHFSWPIIVIDDRFNVLLNETDMKLIGKIHPRRCHQAVRWVAKASLVFSILISCANATVALYAATIAEVAAKIRSLKPQEKRRDRERHRGAHRVDASHVDQLQGKVVRISRADIDIACEKRTAFWVSQRMGVTALTICSFNRGVTWLDHRF